MGDEPFGARRWRLRVLGENDVAMLQRFFDANPEYFVAVGGEAPRPDEAAREFRDVPPAEMAYREMLLLGFFDAEGNDGDAPGDGADGTLVAMATVVSDFIAEHVWHLGLFIVATALHGSGAAHAIYRELERWMVERGARWIRLGVVVGNSRAERFWARSGYLQVRGRGPIETGKKTNMLRVMAKPLAGGDVRDYVALVARDRPEGP